MKRLLCLLLGLLLLAPVACASGDDSDWPLTAEERAKAEAKDRAKAEKSVAGETFKEIHRNEAYIFYLDTRNLRWQPIPYIDGKQMIEVWIKLVPTTPAGTPISAPKTYYLEHYYVRRDTQQIQFLCELEVNGRPTNDVNVGKYDPRKWENLVPGSIEESIYYGVNRYADKQTYRGHGGKSFNDVVEDVLRISI